MNWIRKTVIFVTLLIAALFAFQANDTAIDKSEPQKTENTFSVQNNDAQAFIQPQANYHFAATTKSNHIAIVKWFDSLFAELTDIKSAKFKNNFANQCFNQSKKVAILLYPSHFFW